MRLSADERARGQALVEVAMVLPLFFLLVFGMIDLGRVIWANDVVANAAREGARFASVNAGTLVIGNEAEATKDQIRTHVQGFVVAGGVNTQVTVCFSYVNVAAETPVCVGNTDEVVGANTALFQKGNLVTVRVESQVPGLLVGAIASGTMTVRGESTVLINN
jgi:Flp pilus assembly protein TadG